MKKYILLFALFCFGITLYSQEELKNIDEIINFSLENNLDIRNNSINLKQAKKNIKSILKIDKTIISGSGKIKEDGAISFDSNIIIPVIDQFSINGSINNDLIGSLGISINPLSHNKDKELSLLDYDIAIASSEESINNLNTSVIESALNWMVGYRVYQLKVKEEERYNTLYSDDKDRFNNGSITLDELQNSLINWSDSRKALLQQKQNLYSLESNLYIKLGTTKDETKIIRFEVKDLKIYLQDLKNLLLDKEGNYLNSYDYQSSVFSTSKAKYTYDGTWAFEPDLSASLRVDFDAEGYQANSFVASVNFSLSMDSFNGYTKDKLNEEYLISLKDKELKLNKAKMEFEQSKDLVESSAIETEISLHEYEQAIILLSEADILHKAGEYSELDLLASQIFLQQAENNLFSALKNEYVSILNYLKYF